MAWCVEVKEKNDVRRSTDRFNISLPLNSPVSLSVVSLSFTHTNKDTCENGPHTYSRSSFLLRRVWIPGAPLSPFPLSFCQVVK